MRDKILIVDQNIVNRNALGHILSSNYKIIEANNGAELVNMVMLYRESIAAILIDLMLSQEDDCALINSIRHCEWYSEIPVMVIMGNNSMLLEKKLLEYGISECIVKPFDANLIMLKINNIVRLYEYQNELKNIIERQNKRLKMQNNMLQLQAEYLQNSNNNIIAILGTLVEYRDFESGEHIDRVKRYTEIIANGVMEEFPEYGLTKEQINVIVAASPLHDLGKIAIPNQILMKPGKLTEEEFEYMKSHTLRGCEILEKIKDTWSDEYKRVSMEICHYHHERYDGKGYPEGISGDQIPVSAQIVAVADVYDALVNERVYKDAIPKDKAFRMIIHGECGAFSPQMLEVIRKCRASMEMV